MSNRALRTIFVVLCIGYMLGTSAFFGMVFSGSLNAWGFALGALGQLCAIAILILVVKTAEEKY